MSSDLDIGAPVGAEQFWPTIGEIASWPDLRLLLLTGADRADRCVRIAQTVELEDPAPYLRGNELVLTTGLRLSSPRRQELFVAALAARGASGLGYGVGPVSPRAPRPLVDAARAHGLPLLEVPQRLPFMVLTERIADEQARRRNAWTDRWAAGALLDHVRRGQADPAVVLDHLPHLATGMRLIVAACFDRPSPTAVPAEHSTLIGSRPTWSLAVGEASDVEAYLVEAGIDVYGLSAPGGLSQLQRILGEAVSAHEIARLRGRPATSRDLATVNGLLARLTPDQMAPFRLHVLQPLQKYDAAHNTDLIETVRCLLAHDGSLSKTAKSLYLHINTVRNRLHRVNSVTGVDSTTTDGLTTLRIALSADSWPGPAHGSHRVGRTAASTGAS